MNISLRRRRPATLVALLLCALFVALLQGCADKKPIRSVPPKAQTAAGQAASLSEKAETAWRRGNTVQSEALYQQLVKERGLYGEAEAIAWERYTKSAIANDHYHLAVEALIDWRREIPEAPETPAWRKAAQATVKGLSQVRGSERPLRTILMDPTLPWELRSEAGLLLTGNLWDKGELQAAMETLELLHREASVAEVAETIEVVEPGPPAEYKAGLEAGLHRELSELDDATLQELAELVTADNANRFPYTIIQLENALRNARDEEQWPQSWQAMRRLLTLDAVANKELVQQLLTPLEEQFGQPVQGVVLALPLSGPFSGVGWKILRGVGVAQQKLAAEGVQMQVKAVNTEEPGWIRTLNEQAPGFTLLGGPLRKDRFHALHETNATAVRASFGFVPSLGEAREGVDAWRFFTSFEDQINADLDLAQQELHLSKMALLYPDEPFGHRMAKLFRERVAARGVGLVRAQSYQLGQIEEWNSAVAELLAINRAAMRQSNALPPEPGIDAVFIPDSWSNTEILVPQFSFFQEERILFMGTALWGQSLAKRTDLEMRNYGLVAFPGAWWPENDSPTALEFKQLMDAEGLGEPDFWVALGYDFLRFAARMDGLGAGWTPEEVTMQARAAANMDWAMAPIRYDESGRAAQQLFMFQPSTDGVVRADPLLISERLENARRRHAWWVQTILDKRQEERENKEAAPEEPAQP